MFGLAMDCIGAGIAFGLCFYFGGMAWRCGAYKIPIKKSEAIQVIASLSVATFLSINLLLRLQTVLSCWE